MEAPCALTWAGRMKLAQVFFIYDPMKAKAFAGLLFVT
jgi:hypothetical protein